MRVVVLGVDSYLGSRFAEWIGRIPHTEAVGWAMCKSSDTDYDGVAVYGVDKIEHIVHGADVVINLHEVQDFSLLPDRRSLYCNNVKLVEHLISLHSLPGHKWKLVHLSTPFVQCSSRWPNINSNEIPLHEIPTSKPFKSYCDSKLQADNLLNNSSIDCIIARPVPVYGEGDRCSLITDMLKLSSVIGFVPRICDDDGVMQMVTLHNTMTCLWRAAEKLSDVPSTETAAERIFEIVVLSDNTEKRNFFQNFGDFIQIDDNGLPTVQIPFLAVYYIYFLAALVIRMLSVVYVALWMKQLPDPDYFYMNFYHWTFFNNYKAREYLGYTPLHNKEEQQASRNYYRKLEASTITNFSWENTRPFLNN